MGELYHFLLRTIIQVDLVKMQIPTGYCVGEYLIFACKLFGDNRSLRFSVRLTSVGALFYFIGEKGYDYNLLRTF